MSLPLENQFDALIEHLDMPLLSRERVYPLLDLTRLDEAVQEQEIQDLIRKAQQDHVAAVCVFPQHLGWIPDDLALRRATVVNFPTGDFEHDLVLQTIERTIHQHKVNEIDYVFAYSHYLAGKKNHALTWSHEAYQLCQQHGCTFKVILETGALPSLGHIYQLSCELIENGCDMLKTSTGKISVGATLPAVFAMLNAIKDTQSLTGIKVSGGVKNLVQASAYIHLSEQILEKEANQAWFRIGASQIQG